jgi:hypothetical protein
MCVYHRERGSCYGTAMSGKRHQIKLLVKYTRRQRGYSSPDARDLLSMAALRNLKTKTSVSPPRLPAITQQL